MSNDWDGLAPPGAQLSEAPRESVLGALLRQAFWLSALYLLLGALVAGVRRWFTDATFLTALAAGLDGPARATLEGLGLWERLLRAYAMGTVKGWQWRSILAGLTVLLIHGQALTLGLVLSGVRALYLRYART